VGFNKNQKPLRNFLFVRVKSATLAFDQDPSIAVRYENRTSDAMIKCVTMSDHCIKPYGYSITSFEREQ
jgi:hypothetical protein